MHAARGVVWWGGGLGGGEIGETVLQTKWEGGTYTYF